MHKKDQNLVQKRDFNLNTRKIKKKTIKDNNLRVSEIIRKIIIKTIIKKPVILFISYSLTYIRFFFFSPFKIVCE